MMHNITIKWEDGGKKKKGKTSSFLKYFLYDES